MTTKLTLSVNKATIQKAKMYARKTGRSLSELVQSHLERLIQENKDNAGISPRLKKIAGSAKLPKDFDDKKELRAYFEKKHLWKGNYNTNASTPEHMKKVFVDTNILIDLLGDRKPFSKYAIEIFDKAERRKVELFVSSHSFATTHYLLKKYMMET